MLTRIQPLYFLCTWYFVFGTSCLVLCFNKVQSTKHKAHLSCCSNYFVQQSNQILIVDALLAIRQVCKTRVRRIELSSRDVVAEFHVAKRQRMPPGMFAKHE